MKKVFILFVSLLFECQFVIAKGLLLSGSHNIQPPGTPAGSSAKALTVAGGNGQGTDANQLNSPQGLYVDEQNNIKPNSAIALGKNFRPGIYFIELKQGTQTIVEKVIKQ